MPDALSRNGAATPLLEADEPAPVQVLNPCAARPLLLVCDHASARLPRGLGDLGLDAAARHSHLAVDIGAAAVTARLATALDVTAVLAGYSRLAVDCNRDPADPQAYLDFGDGVAIPGNRGLTAEQKQRRSRQLFQPYHAAIEAQLARLTPVGASPVMLAIHSFTPVFEGVARPWDAGILWDGDPRVATALMQGLGRVGLTVGDNQPYPGTTRLNYTLKRHAAAAGLGYACIEMRQDHVGDEAGIERMAALLGGLIDTLEPQSLAAAGDSSACGKRANEQESVISQG